MSAEAAINKTLDLKELDNTEYATIVLDVKQVMEELVRRGHRFTTYQAEFGTGWGENDVWLRRKLWEIATIVSYSRITKNLNVLDCGGASTIFSFYLASIGSHVSTVDIDWRKQGIVDNAQKVSRSMGWGMYNMQADMSRLPFQDSCFDRVFSICVLEHIDRGPQSAAIKEMSRVLAPGGIMGLTFDYGPFAFGNCFADVQDLNNRIVFPSGLSVIGNLDYAERGWFPEQKGKTWGALFLRKDGIRATHSRTLICSKPQARLVLELRRQIRRILDMLRNFLSYLGVRHSNPVYIAWRRIVTRILHS